MADNKEMPLTLKITSPDGSLPEVYCDSITLCIADNLKGTGGGSYGIRKGHADALIAIGKGEIRAFADGVQIFSHPGDRGFARICKSTITISE